MHLEDDLYMTDGDLLEVLSEIEDELEIDLDDQNIAITYVSDLIAYVKSKL